MAKCEHCGNDYDKTSKLNATAKCTSSTASSAPFTLWRLNAITAVVESLATASKAVRECFAAPIALAKAVKTGYAIAVERCWHRSFDCCF
jgi:hypothetical protein